MPKKLLELIAVEQQLKTQATATRADLRNTFEKKRHLFEEKRVTFTPKGEAVATVEEQSDIQTTVIKELDWVAGIWTKALDTSFRIAKGNALAKADVVLDDGTTLFADVPAYALLDLEKRATEFQDLIASIPTLDPAKGFRLDPDKGPNIYKAREVNKVRTKKVQVPLVKYEATQQHPAQVDVISVDIDAGQIMQQEWSALITPADKGELIERVEELRRALKAALHRANAVELEDTVPGVGKRFFDFVLTETV